MSEAKIFNEYLKCDIDNVDEIKGVQLEKMFSNYFMGLQRASLFVNKCVT